MYDEFTVCLITHNALVYIQWLWVCLRLLLRSLLIQRQLSVSPGERGRGLMNCMRTSGRVGGLWAGGGRGHML